MEKYCKLDGGSLHYRDIGNGNPILLIHGFAEDGSVWDPMIPLLTNSFRLIIPDLPGSGNSPFSIVEKKTPCIEILADCIQQLIAAENLSVTSPAPALIGHSMGGYVALAHLSKYPTSNNAVVLFHSTAYADNEEKKAARKKGIAFIEAYGSPAFLKATVPSFFSAAFLEKYPEKVDLHIERYSRISGAALIWYYEAMIRRPDRTDLLRSCTQPIGFILGMEDKLIPAEQILNQASLPRISSHTILHHTGHMGMIEETEKAASFVEKFLTTGKTPEREEA